MKKIILIVAALSCLLQSVNVFAGSIAYIHGRVAANGEVLDEGVGNPFDQMLITDTGDRGLSQFKALVEAQGHSIVQFRDTQVTLNAVFLDSYDVVIFGLHQKMWLPAEKAALGAWLNDGGGMFIYSDSASGGSFGQVPGGAQNPVGRDVTNNLIQQYGMRVTVDQANGIPNETVLASASIAAIRGLVLQGEGVSPISVPGNNSLVEILSPYTFRAIKADGDNPFANPIYASLVLRPVGDGHIVVMFDRQPMWNVGSPGSDIGKANNSDILREVINFLAERPVVPPPNPPTTPNTPSGASSLPPVINLLLDEPE